MIISAIKELYEPKGYEVRYSTMPWSRAIAEVNTGKKLILAGCSEEDAEGLLLPKRKLITTTPKIFSLSSFDVAIHSLEQLANYKVACVVGYKYSQPLNDFLLKNKENKNIIMVGGKNPGTEIIKLLEQKKIDMVVEDEKVFFANIREMGRNKSTYRVVSQIFGSNEITIAFSNKDSRSKELMNLFEQQN